MHLVFLFFWRESTKQKSRVRDDVRVVVRCEQSFIKMQLKFETMRLKNAETNNWICG